MYLNLENSRDDIKLTPIYEEIYAILNIYNWGDMFEGH